MSIPSEATAKVTGGGDRLIVKTWDITQYPGEYPLVIVQGGDFTLKVEWVDGDGDPRDLSGYSASLAFRKHPDDSSALATITPSISGDVITINATAATTANYDWTRAYYDLKLTDGSSVVTVVLEGTADLQKLVTS